MRSHSEILTIDGVANLLFGTLLLLAPRGAFEILGLPWTERALWAVHTATRRRRHRMCRRSSSAVGLSTSSRNGSSGPE